MAKVSGQSITSLLLTAFFLGVYEALELRDGGSDYLGKGVSKVSDSSLVPLDAALC